MLSRSIALNGASATRRQDDTSITPRYPLTAEQIENDCPEIQDLGHRIAAHLDKARAYEAKAHEKAGAELRKADNIGIRSPNCSPKRKRSAMPAPSKHSRKSTARTSVARAFISC